MGETCTLSIGDTQEEITVDNSSASTGFGMGGMQPGGFDREMFGGRGNRADRFDGNRSNFGNMDRDGSRFGDMQEMPDMPDMGEMPDMQKMPEMSEMPEMPDGDYGRGNMQRNRSDWGDALILVVVSVLSLLAGMAVALKTK